jgi:hypothetical protein
LQHGLFFDKFFLFRCQRFFIKKLLVFGFLRFQFSQRFFVGSALYLCVKISDIAFQFFRGEVLLLWFYSGGLFIILLRYLQLL